MASSAAILQLLPPPLRHKLCHSLRHKLLYKLRHALYPILFLTLPHPVRNFFTQFVTHLITHSTTINGMHSATNSIILCQFIKNFHTNYFLYTLYYVTHCVTFSPTIYVAHSFTHSAANYVTHSVTHYVHSSRIPPLKMSSLVRIKERYRSWQP